MVCSSGRQLLLGLFAKAKKKQIIQKRLSSIVYNSNNSIIAPEKHLDEIYTGVLKHSIPAELSQEEEAEICATLRDILGCIVVLFSPLSTNSLERLLFTQKGEINEILEDVHAILDIPKEETQPLRLLHPSFRDFLLDNDRCQDPKFLVDEKQVHQKLSASCIRLMSASLKQDICGSDAPGALAADIDSSQVKRHLPHEVQYARLYWIRHLQQSDAQLYDDDQVHQFLQRHFLHWLEALGWMQKVSEGIQAVSALQSVVMVC